MITFVTALFQFCENRTYTTTLDYLRYFEPLAESGLLFHVFLDERLYDLYVEHIGIRDNIHLTLMKWQDLPFYAECLDIPLPPIRNIDKDTTEFMILMNSKTEFAKRAIEANVFKSTHFAWIDFGIRKIISNEATIDYLKNYDIQESGLYMPAIHLQSPVTFVAVCWRFCGGFFIGDSESILKFHSVYEQYFLDIVTYCNILPWEVNMWAYFEQQGYFKPIVYYADHNDSMLLAPCNSGI